MSGYLLNPYILGGAVALPDETEYVVPGSYTWTAPDGVTSVCVLCIGGGGGGHGTTSGGTGGGGGGLGWKNNIPVTPGGEYPVVVGAGGAASTAGGDSYFISPATVAGFGGAGGIRTPWTAAGGGYVGDGGGNGGAGRGGPAYGGGGGGAGGYSGNGGNGGVQGTTGVAGSGGGGGGGGGSGSADSSGAGGGTGIYGEGINGTAGAGSGGNSLPAFGGSRGGGGSYAPGNSARPSTGGVFGGGGGGSDNGSERGPGAQGAVRIIWGEGRSFPTTDVDDYKYLSSAYQDINFTSVSAVWYLYNNNTKQVSGTNINGSNAWNNSCTTDQIYAAPCTLEVEAWQYTLSPKMIGFTTTAGTANSYTTGLYLWYLFAPNHPTHPGLSIYESGALAASVTGSTIDSIYKIYYATDGNIYYYLDNTLIRTVAAGVGNTYRIGFYGYYGGNCFNKIRIKNEAP